MKSTLAEPTYEHYKCKIRKSYTGFVTMINDHLYEGRFTPRVNGKRISKNVYEKTREECEEKLAELIKTMKAESHPKRKRQNRHKKRGRPRMVVPQNLRQRKQRKAKWVEKFIEI